MYVLSIRISIDTKKYSRNHGAILYIRYIRYMLGSTCDNYTRAISRDRNSVPRDHAVSSRLRVSGVRVHRYV